MRIFDPGNGNHPTLLSRAKNLMYRKGVEPSPGQWGARFRYLQRLHDHEPRILGALHALPELGQKLALFELHDPDLRIYSGREFIIFNERRYLYYRMPGALPNGGGAVPAGRYRVVVTAIEDSRRLFLDLEKSAPASFSLISHSIMPPAEPAAYTPLEARELDYSWIINEINDLIFRWLSWQVAAIDTGVRVPTQEQAAALMRVVEPRPWHDARVESEVVKLLARLRGARSRATAA